LNIYEIHRIIGPPIDNYDAYNIASNIIARGFIGNYQLIGTIPPTARQHPTHIKNNTMQRPPPTIHCLPPRPLIGGSLINKEAYQKLSQLKHFSCSIQDGDYKESASDQELEQALHEELQHLDHHQVTTTDVDAFTRRKGHKHASSSRDANNKTQNVDSTTTTNKKHHHQQRWSSLSADEHSWYLSHINALDDLSEKDATRMMSLMQAVSKEREEYKKAILSTWLPPTLPALDAMSGRQKSQIEEDVKQRQEAVARQYARYWKFHSILPLKSNNNNNNNNNNSSNSSSGVAKKDEDCLFLATTGTLPALQIPSSLDDGVPVSLPTTLSYLPATIAMYNNKTTKAHQPTSKKQKTGLKSRASGGKKNTVVIERPYRKAAVAPLHQFVEDAHLLYRPSATTSDSPTLLISKSTTTPGTIVADASALIAIASTPLMSHYQDRQLQKSWCWEIPVSIDEEGRVIIEKPLHPRAVTKRALMTRLYKYAALSVLLPEPLGEAEAEDKEEVGGQESNCKWKAKRAKRLRSSANPASKAAPKQTPTQSTVSPSPRHTMFGKVKVGEHHVFIRSHAMYHVPIENTSLIDDDATKEKEKHHNTSGLVPVVFGVKSDYLDMTTIGGDDGEVEEEIFSELEVCHWLLKLLFCPGTEGVMVARVHVPHNKLVSCEYLSRRELEENLDTAPCLDFLSTVLTDVKKQQWGAGRYILSPVGGQDNVSIAVYTTSDDDKYAGGRGRGGGGGTATAPVGGGTSTNITVLPLPCGGTTTTAAAMQQKQQKQGGKVVYDLHEALRLSGRMTILPQHAFLPPRWHPYRLDDGDDDNDDDEGKEELKMSQIPDTFPPRPKDGDGDKTREGRKNKEKGKGKKRRGGEEGKKSRRKRKRQRRLLPHAWSVLGKGGDFDSLLDQQQKPMDMSRKNYMDQLEEEI